MDLDAGQALERGQAQQLPPLIEVPRVFTPEECARIVSLRSELGFDAAPIPVDTAVTARERSHAVDTSVRHTERTHVLSSAKTRWIYDRLSQTVTQINQKTWGFRVSYMEPLQLLRYPVGGRFRWHSDLGDRGLTSLRKISATILLSSGDAYAGGDLQLMSGAQVLSPVREQGRGAFFPSFVNHRVTPVSAGHRDVLILWTVGKRSFR